MEVKAQLNYLHISPRKVRLVASLVKGMDTERAEAELRSALRRPALPLLKLLKSAEANAKANFDLDPRGLYIKSLRVDEGPVLKRWRARAFGRAAMIRKRTSHVSLVLETKTVTSEKKKRPKKDKPVVRVLREEDLKAMDAGKEEHEKKLTKMGGLKPKRSADFVRRMFRRKAI